MEDRVSDSGLFRPGEIVYVDDKRFTLGDVVQRITKPPAIKRHTNAEMIHEMLERGYAVMKIPADGKLKGLGDGGPSDPCDHVRT